MRSVINISLPSQLEEFVNIAIEKGNFANKSEFFRHLLRNHIENNLKEELEESRKELAKGKGKLLKSLKDLR